MLTSADDGTSWVAFNDGLTIQDIQYLTATARLPVTLYVSTKASTLLVRTADVLTAAVTNPGDFNNDGRVDFSDFAQFAGGFGKSQGNPGFNPVLDMDNDGSVAFGDFIQFAQVFGKTYASGKLGVNALPEDLTAKVVLQTDLNSLGPAYSSKRNEQLE